MSTTTTSSTTTLARRRNGLAFAAGILSLLIGGAALAGYATKQPWLVTFLPGSAPIRLASAIGIFCCGAAVLLLAGGYRRTCAGLAFAAGVVAAADLAAAAAGFGIALEGPRFGGTLAGCLLIIGAAALVLMSGVVRLPSRLAIVGSVGSVLHSIGLVAIIAYAAGVSNAFTDGAFTQLGVHTAVAIAAIGAALIRFAWRDTLATDIGTPAWLPLLVGAGTLATALCLYGAIVSDDQSDFAHQVTFEAEGLRQFMQAGLDNRIQPLIRLARQRAVAPDMKKDEWDADAQMIMTRGGYQAIEWVDAAGRVVWTSPPGAGDATPDGNAAFESRRRAAFDAAKRNRTVAATQPIDLVTGGKGTIVLVPVFAKDGVAGYVAGVFRYQLLFQSLLSSNPSPRYSIAVHDGGELLFSQGAASTSEHLKRTADVRAGEGKWTLAIAPTEALAVQSKSPAAGALLTIGVFLAAFFSLLVRVAQRSGGARTLFEARGAALSGGPLASGDGVRVPVLSYNREGAVLSWNDEAASLFAGEPPRIPACDSAFRTVTAAMVRCSGTPENVNALRALLESCTSPALLFDAEGRYVAANSAASRLLGWSDEGWAGRTISPGLPSSREAFEIQNALLMQGNWFAPAERAAAAAVFSAYSAR